MKQKKNHSVAIFLSSIMELNCVWTLAPKGQAVVNYLSNQKHRETYFCEKNKIFHINFGSISLAFEMHKMWNIPSSLSYLNLVTVYKTLCSSKLLLHLNKKMTLGIIMFLSPLSNEYISRIQKKNLFYILFLA